MAMETVEAIRKAESIALQTEEAAAKERDAILKKAHQDAAETISQMTEQAQVKAKKALEEAQCQGEAFVESACQRAEEEIARLKDAVRAKEQAAIALVISELV